MSSLSAASAASSLLGSSRLSVGGLATGFDVDKIIQGLLNIEQKRLEKLQADQVRVKEQQTAFKGIEARLLTLQTQFATLGRAQNGAFELHSVSSSDDNLVSAAANASAAPGVYQLKVNSLAQAHQIASQGFDSASAAITQGSFQIRTGSGTTATITIDSGNNTLQGLATAINNANVGVAATIVHDGAAGQQQPYRLLLSSAKTGAANAIVITNGLAADGGGAFKPVFDQSIVGPARLDPTFTGTSVASSNSGPGVFTGSANNAYTFTVVTGGAVGVDNGLQLAFTDLVGTHTGTITLNAADVDTFKTVAEGIQVKLGAGTLVAGETFTIRAFVPEVQEAANASVTLGSGNGALTIQNAGNEIDGLFPGVSLSLKQADPTRTVTLTVSANVSSARQSILDFVEAFNGLMGFIDEQVKYDPQTAEAGTLLGNRQATAIQDQVRSIVLAPVPGLKKEMNRLSALGITITDQGKLSINQTRLDDALAGRIDGVGLDDVRRLFALAGQSSHDAIEFVTGGVKTRTSGLPYQVVIQQAAEQATIQATNPLAAITTLNSGNNAFSIQVDSSTSVPITLQAGSYSRLALVQGIQAALDASAALAGRGVNVSLNGNSLVLTSRSHGSASRLGFEGGTALASLGFTGSETDTGTNVAGHFLVNGLIENASGSGQVLFGAPDNANSADLQVRVTATPAQIGAGLTADLTVTRGVASALDATLGSLLDPVSGRLKTVDGGFQEQVDNIQAKIARETATAQRRRDALVARFVALETTISKLQNLGAYLGTQLAQINNTTQRR